MTGGYAADLAANCSPWSIATIKAQVQSDHDRSFAEAVAAADEVMLSSFDHPGVTVVRGLPVFGYQDREGHGASTATW